MMKTWLIHTRETGLPLLEAVSLRVPAAPQAFLRQLCKKGRIALNGNVASASVIVTVGDIVTVKPSTRFAECIVDSRILPWQVLYEDRECMVIDKPAGLAIHNAVGHGDNLLQRLRDFLELRGETFQVAPIHRLDIGTSGAVLFGKGRSSISQLGQAIMSGGFTKRYLALVSGALSEPVELTAQVRAKGKLKSAKAKLRPLATNNSYTLVELELETGRQHQLRQQLTASGWPIAGDRRYNGEAISGLNRPFLHCHTLGFPHPVSGQTIEISCPLPADLLTIMSTLDITVPSDLGKTE